jgi:hypothetical protein
VLCCRTKKKTPLAGTCTCTSPKMTSLFFLLFCWAYANPPGHLTRNGHAPVLARKKSWSVLCRYVHTASPRPATLSVTVHRRFGRFGTGVLEPAQQDLRRAATLIFWVPENGEATRDSSLINAAPPGTLASLCCNRTFELILCRSCSRLVNYHLETSVPRGSGALCCLVSLFQNSSDLSSP